MSGNDSKSGDKLNLPGNGREQRLAETIQAWMVLRLSEELKVPRAAIDGKKPFLDHGLDSVVAFSLTGELADWLSRDFPVTLFWDFPTVESLALYLAAQIKDREDLESLVAEIDRALSAAGEALEDGLAGKKRD